MAAERMTSEDSAPLARRTVPRDWFSRWTRRRTVVAAVLLIGLGAGLWAWLRPTRAQPLPLAYSELVDALDGGRVESLVVRPGMDIQGEWRTASLDRPGMDFVVAYPLAAVDDLAQRADRAGARLTLEPAPERGAWRDVASLGLLAVLIALVGWLFVLGTAKGEIIRLSLFVLASGVIAYFVWQRVQRKGASVPTA